MDRTARRRTGGSGGFNCRKQEKAKFERALPRWEEAQTLVRKKLGEQRWSEAMKFTNDITRAIVAQRS